MTDVRVGRASAYVLVRPPPESRVARTSGYAALRRNVTTQVGRSSAYVAIAQPRVVQVGAVSAYVLVREKISATWWSGAALKEAEVLGWWDGAAIQPLRTMGWWDGAAVQPLTTVVPPQFTPASIPGLGLWLDATKITALADGDPVTTWFDASANGRNAVSIDTPPRYRGAAVNGHPAVEFIGGITGPQEGTRLQVPGLGTALSGSTEYTLFQVIQQRGNYARYPVHSTAPTNNLWQWLTEYNTDGSIYWGAVNGRYRRYLIAPAVGTTHLFTYRQTTTEPRFYYDGTEITSYTIAPGGDMLAPVPNLGTDILIGGYYTAGLGIDGYICAYLWYDHALTDAQRSEVETYLKTKWAL